MTSSIARMNCFLHGIEDFQIVRGDTLSEPKFVQRDRLMRFDVVLANPPYSIKQWDRDAFASDPWGRNLFGTPPQGRADYAFWQHILCSLAPKTGRCAILFPHGVLFRQEEEEMRRKLIETDTVECVIGLGPNLFYNAAMEACVVICRTSKPKARKGRILFINAVNEVTRERAQSFLTEDHIGHIADAYDSFKDQPGLAKVTALEEVRKNGHSLKIDLYVATPCASNGKGVASVQDNEFTDTLAAWGKSRTEVRDALSSALSDPKMDVYRGDDFRLTPQADIRRHFDHEKWTRARFGDVVSFVKESIDPNSGELDRYVAGDHMETDNVHIRRWGTVGEGYLGPAFIRRFRKGQVLYGSRRTYLKKVAYAEFDGITANTTFVLEGVDGKLHQPLLPWLMLSQRFTEHSVRESKGSTNPYINFPDIAKFEIDLPPIDQQRRMAEILWALDEVVMKTAAASEDSSHVVDAELNNFLYKSSNWRMAECRELLIEGPRNGFSPPASATSGRIPTLSISAIRGGRVVPNGSLKYADVSSDEVSQFRLQRDDILIVRGNGNRLLCGRAGIVDQVPEGCFYPDLLIRLRFPADCLLPKFAVMQWNEVKTHTRLLKKAKSSNGIYKINGQDIQSHRLVVPPVTEQVRFLERLERKAAATFALESSATDALNLQRSLINTLLS
jgi:restriction endonuclease S subunit